jgi:hypothetical protein
VTTLQRCQQRNYHATHDGNFTVSDAAASYLMQGRFPSSHSVGCDCAESKGEIKPEDCQNVNIRDADGNLIARFATKEFGAARDSNGQIIVYRRPAATKDSATKLTLHRLNQIHAEFYKRGDL